MKGQKSAWLVFGIRDKDKYCVDTQFRNNLSSLHSLKSEIGNQTTNRITFVEIYEVKNKQGRVILFEIPAAPQGIPIAWKGHYYARDGETLQALNLEKLERIRSQANQKDWSAKVIKNATLADLSKDAIFKARKLYKIKNAATQVFKSD